LNLEPGVDGAQVNGVAGASAVSRLEIYEAP